MTTFAANGLLGSLQPPLVDPSEPSTVSTFSSNGLLGLSSSGTFFKSRQAVEAVQDPSALEDLPSKSIEPTVETLKEPQFSANGLLSRPRASSTSNDVFIPSGLLSESQDDYLPTISEAFGNHSAKNASIIADITSTNSSSTAYVPRVTIRAKTFDGKTIYMKRRTRVKAPPNQTTQSGHRIGNLLDVPIHRMMDELSATAAANLSRADRQPIITSSSSSSIIEDTLWVDRYRPRCFTELMGNERVARETMAWVKQWDWCVFGKNKGKKRPRDGDENFKTEDEYHRPNEKLLLLSGPPGLGKTTLAHVIARQAGYEVMEINASDARSGQIVDDRIRPALESGSAVGSSKPVLLIIDEIDGATGAGDSSSTFIHKLVQLTHDRPRKKLRSGQTRDPQAKRPILRPIICICNDQNAASLAKLRPHVYQVRVSRPADIHTVKRLRQVCDIEGLRADTRALNTLVGVAKGDLRGCLNALQFIKSKNEEVTEAIIRGATVGMKEADTTIVSVLNSLFNPMTRKRAKELALGEEEESKYVGRLSREVDGSGRESSVAIGCFAHYVTLHQHDANFSRYEKATEWLGVFDTLSSAMYSDGDFGLSSYLPYMLVPFYPLFQERGGQRVERSQADWESLQRTRANEEIYKSLARCLRSASSHHGGDFRHLVSTPILQLEFAPYINRIISPPLRPVNSQVIRPEERALLSRLVSIMASLELRFLQERAEDGQLTYRLDPPIDVFVTYDGKRAADIAVSRYAVRHLVAGEIDAQLLARQADVVEKSKTGRLDYFGRSSKKAESAEPTPSPDKRLVGSKQAEISDFANKRARTEKVTDIADKPPTDFFGRLITVQSASSTKAAARKNVEKKYRVTYRFTEGNSAAVRKPIKLEAFL